MQNKGKFHLALTVARECKSQCEMGALTVIFVWENFLLTPWSMSGVTDRCYWQLNILMGMHLSEQMLTREKSEEQTEWSEIKRDGKEINL